MSKVKAVMRYAQAEEQEYTNIYSKHSAAPMMDVMSTLVQQPAYAMDRMEEAMPRRRANFWGGHRHQYQAPVAPASYDIMSQNSVESTYGREEVWCSRRTVKDGERVAVWDNSTGRCVFIDGPARPYLFRKTIERLRQYRASPETYLVVQHRDGRKEHIKGPVSLFFDPLEHQSIKIARGINMNMSEAIVVYRGDEDARVSREIIHGPAVYVPHENEWLEQFAWGKGSEASDPPPARFTKLKCTPQQFFVDVENVRTTDNQILIVSYMVIFQLMDVERMLHQTNDPLADFSNALCADVINVAAKMAFEALKEFTDRLNDIASYPQLLTRAKESGFVIHKVAFRGYQTTPNVRRMQEEGVKARTMMALERETQEEREAMVDFKQHAEQKRAQEKHEFEKTSLEHTIKLKELETQAHVDADQRLLAMRLNAENEKAKVGLEMQTELMKQKVEFVRSLSTTSQLNVTDFLVAQASVENPRVKVPEGFDKRGFLPPFPSLDLGAPRPPRTPGMTLCETDSDRDVFALTTSTHVAPPPPPPPMPAPVPTFAPYNPYVVPPQPIFLPPQPIFPVPHVPNFPMPQPPPMINRYNADEAISRPRNAPVPQRAYDRRVQMSDRPTMRRAEREERYIPGRYNPSINDDADECEMDDDTD